MIIVLCWQNLKNLTWKKLHSLFTKLWVKRFYMNLIFVLNKYMAYFEPTSKFLGVSIHCLPGSDFYSSPKLRRTKSKTFLWLDRDNEPKMLLFFWVFVLFDTMCKPLRSQADLLRLKLYIHKRLVCYNNSIPHRSFHLKNKRN